MAFFFFFAFFFSTCLVSVVLFTDSVKILHNLMECPMVKVQDLSKIRFQTCSKAMAGNGEVDELTVTIKEVFIR